MSGNLRYCYGQETVLACLQSVLEHQWWDIIGGLHLSFYIIRLTPINPQPLWLNKLEI